MSGERCYTTRTWQRLSWIESWSVAALSNSMDPREEPVILTWNSSCLRSRNGSEFPELPAQNFRNPQEAVSVTVGKVSWIINGSRNRGCKNAARNSFSCYIEDVKRQLQFRSSLRLLSRSRLSY